MDFTGQLASKYQSLFTLPTAKLLILMLFVIGTTIGGITYLMVPRPQLVYFGMVDGVCSLAIGGIVSAYLVSGTSKQAGVLDFRRTVAMITFGLLLMGIGLIAGAVGARIFQEEAILEKAYFVSSGLLVAFYSIVLSVTSDLKGLKLYFTSLLQPSITLALHLGLLVITGYIIEINPLSYVASFALVALFASVVARWYCSQIENVGKGVLGFGSLSLLKAFINALMLDRTDYIESVLESISVTKDVEIRTLTFNSNNGQGVIVAPLTHPGPFRNVGGATLPTNIAKALLSKEVCPVVFHTPTTHDTDIASSREANEVLQKVMSMVESDGVDFASKPVCVKRGDVTVTCQIFGNTPLVVITRSPVPTEDLPQTVHDLCIEKILEKGYPDGVVVDAHNAMEKGYLPFSDVDRKNLATGLEEALSWASKTIGTLYAGCHNAKVGKYGKKDGIGEGGIMALVTSVSGSKAAFVSLDGNNMVTGLREKICSALIKKGYDVAEVATTDTHIVTGRTQGEGYYALGVAIPEDSIIDGVIEAVNVADSKLSACLVKFSKQVVPQLHVLGERGIERLWNVTDQSISVAKSRAYIVIIVLLVVGILAYAII